MARHNIVADVLVLQKNKTYITGALYWSLLFLTALLVRIYGAHAVKHIDHYFDIERPFVYRALLSWLADTIQFFITVDFEIWLYERLLPLIIQDYPQFLYKPEDLMHFIICLLLGAIALMIYGHLTGVIARQLFSFSHLARRSLAIGAILIAALFMRPYSQIYDPLTLCFSALMTWLLISGRSYWYTAMVIPAIINRETAFYFIALFGLYHFFSGNLRSVIGLIVCQFLAAAVVKIFLTFYYADIKGAFLWFMLDRTLGEFIEQYILGLAVLLGCGFLMFAYWRHRPLVLRCWSILSVFGAVAFFLFSRWVELRTLFEFLPAFILSTCFIVRHLLNRRSDQGRHAS
jgi:hypothetical protein